MSLIERDRVIAQLDTLNDQIEERWTSLSQKQVEQLKNGIEGLWLIVCRRKGPRA